MHYRSNTCRCMHDYRLCACMILVILSIHHFMYEYLNLHPHWRNESNGVHNKASFLTCNHSCNLPHIDTLRLHSVRKFQICKLYVRQPKVNAGTHTTASTKWDKLKVCPSKIEVISLKPFWLKLLRIVPVRRVPTDCPY